MTIQIMCQMKLDIKKLTNKQDSRYSFLELQWPEFIAIYTPDLSFIL